MLIEKKLEIDFVDAELEKISRVGYVAQYAYQLQKNTTGKTLNEVQGIIIDTLINDFDIPKIEITLNSCIVRDLGIN